jgi:hypothetical protein
MHMNLTLQSAQSGDAYKIERELDILLRSARTSYVARQTRKTLDTLHSAHALAAAHGLHRDAARFKRALSILAQGRCPKLLTRRDAHRGGQEDH